MIQWLRITVEGIYPERETCIPLFIAALFTIARTWKQPRCPSTDEWIKKLWYIYTVEYYSATKKNKILPLATMWMDLESIRSDQSLSHV